MKTGEIYLFKAMNEDIRPCVVYGRSIMPLTTRKTFSNIELGVISGLVCMEHYVDCDNTHMINSVSILNKVGQLSTEQIDKVNNAINTWIEEKK